MLYLIYDFLMCTFNWTLVKMRIPNFNIIDCYSSLISELRAPPISGFPLILFCLINTDKSLRNIISQDLLKGVRRNKRCVRRYEEGLDFYAENIDLQLILTCLPTLLTFKTQPREWKDVRI